MNFRAKTILGIALIEIVLLVILVFSALSFLGDSNEKQLLQRAQATTTMFAHAVKDAVLATDLATLDDLVNEIMTLEDVVYVRIVSNDRVLAASGKSEHLDDHQDIDKDLHSIKDGIFDTEVDIISDDVSYGHIDIGFATSAISVMLTQAKKSIIGIASLEVLLVALFSFILGTYLTKNLVKLKRAAQIVRKQGPGYQIKLNQKDELGEVAEAFNSMSKSLHDSYQDLHQAREEAEHANETKSRFLASMSHEIRTPMNGVLGLLDALNNTPLNSEQQKLVATASDSGKLLLSVINDILDFSRMEAHNIAIERKAFDLKATVRTITDSFQPAAGNKGIELLVDSDKLPDYLVGDQTRYRQILLNLIGNAIKFTDQGSVKVTFDFTGQPDSTVICRVSDTGIGIQSESIPFLFEEFTMTDQSFSRPHEGSGLGLAICKRLVDLMEGDIEVTSTEGIGSCFTFSVPMTVASQAEIDKSSFVPASLNERCRNINILIAEDNKANQLVILSLLKGIGLTADIAENGQQAVEKVEQNRYDIVFMDISMPKMDGMQACGLIRKMADKQKARLPVIAFTAHALTGDKEKFLNAGMTDYLTKPVQLSQLIETLNRYSVLTQEQKPEEKHMAQQGLSDREPVTENDNLVVDEVTLAQLVRDTSAEVVPALIDHYIEEANKHCRVITEADREKDAEKLKFELHTLSSSSKALGNTALSALAKQLELACIQGDESTAFNSVGQLIELAEGSLQQLDQRKQQGFS
ncbi:ATP-binding protein [Vibrio sp. SCSIO 43137]|uniref:ATP-binding protein n=1 Tax=Vibrio sp. SCSIO 43137 TaxID=3021011 RepID=UPI002307E3FD|nr:ATP-binding protein [Vibrio sp. SCSIO 43137]WCE31965.1 ATP-binding protein [Vibrio sp. SCSIO 43137]